MENDENKNEILVQNNDNSNRIFKLDYEGQNIENNNNFIQWKQSMLSIYGNNTKFFKCLKDNILFCKNDDLNHDIFFYQNICPICQNRICYYCSRYGRDIFFENASCCLKRKIKYIFIRDKYFFLNQNINVESRRILFKQYFIIFLIPIAGFLLFIARIQTSFFYKLLMKNTILRDDGILPSYKNHLNKKDLVITINIIFSCILAIPFLIINIYTILLVLLISVPFKLIPLKIILGIAFGRFTW